MSEYGIKIKNFEAGSLYGYNLGIRDRLDSTDAMLTNSLFSDFLKENGLNIWKGESTRDVICIEFNYGTRSYEEEIQNFEKIIKNLTKDEKLSEEQKQERIQKIEFLMQRATDNKEKFQKKSHQDIRTLFYTHGVDINYQTHNKKGEVIKEERIHYKMLYRTPGKAKKGSCMFINEVLYDKAREFLYMGIQLPEDNSPIVEMGAYSSLVTSSIVGKVQILPEQILVVNDVDSFFNTNIISVETDKNKHCVAIPKSNYRVKNTLFDGQALIDTSIFPDWGDGYILLRHHMCKMAAFHSNIQLFMKEYFGAMLSRGATTFWEDFNMDWLKGSGRIDELPKEGERDIHGDYGAFCYEGFRHSLCHGWASGVLAFFIEYILGISVEHGGKKVCIEPHLFGIEEVEAKIPLREGWLSISIQQGKIQVEAPDGVDVSVMNKIARRSNDE